MDAEHIMVGCDLHGRTMLLMIATSKHEPEKRTVQNSPEGRAKMIEDLQQRAAAHGGATVVFAYEACCLGFGLYDELTHAGMICHVLAPSKLERSAHARKNKTDEKDARRVLKALRSHLLAGEDLPSIWVPDPQARADRGLLRRRLTVGDDVSACKNQIQCWLKTHGIAKPKGMRNWTRTHRAWLARLADQPQPDLHPVAQLVLQSLRRDLEAREQEVQTLDKHMADLATRPRYAEPVQELIQITGMGLLSAMVFLTEMGDLSRFHNRRQVGAYLGLAPSAHESGDVDDRKGHITRQGPSRVRKILCQAVWVRIRYHEPTQAHFQELTRRAPKRKKLAVVAHMRKLAIRLWHRGLEAQQRVGAFGTTRGCRP